MPSSRASVDSSGRQRRAAAKVRVKAEGKEPSTPRPTDDGAPAEGARGGTKDRRGSDMVAQSLGRIGAIYAGAREESVMRL